MAKRFQVVIVGGGPVGVALAVQLGMRGITCGLVETRTGLGAHPQGPEPDPPHARRPSTSWAWSMSCAPRG